MPSFWERLSEEIEAGIIVSPVDVLLETEKRSPELHKWLKVRERCIVEIDDDLQDAVAEIVNDHPLMAKNRKGASSADAWVVSLAHLRAAIVVSEESLADSDKRPKIPGVCKQRNIMCMNLLGFMRAERWTI